MASRSATKTAMSGGRAGRRSADGLARTDPFQLLEAEHELLRAQFRRTIGPATDGPAVRRKAIDALVAVARRHMEREGRALYPVCERLFGEIGPVSVLRTDHSTIRTALADLPNHSADLADRLDRLGALLEGHLAREERVLFPLMSALLSGTEMDRLARELRAERAPRGTATRTRPVRKTRR